MLICSIFFFLMIRRPPRSTLFPSRRSSDLVPLREGNRRMHVRPRVFTLDEKRIRARVELLEDRPREVEDRKSTRLNSSHGYISYAVFCLKKKNRIATNRDTIPTSRNKLTTS